MINTDERCWLCIDLFSVQVERWLAKDALGDGDKNIDTAGAEPMNVSLKREIPALPPDNLNDRHSGPDAYCFFLVSTKRQLRQIPCSSNRNA
ncbi:MAG: hypothetical protein ABSG75_11360 [Syntrophales bacterium]|jgi:hypothetical protein